MDSRDVNRVLKQVVWDELRGDGFLERTGRTAWRRREHTIDVVNFQSFNAYLAEQIAATTFSFSVRLGVAYPVDADDQWMLRPPSDRPKEFECQARRTPRKGVAQEILVSRRRWFAVDPAADEWEVRNMDRPDVWFVDLDGSNTEWLASDALAQIMAQGMPWFEELSDLDRAIEIFGTREGTSLAPGTGGDFYGGALGSPSRFATVASLKAKRAASA